MNLRAGQTSENPSENQALLQKHILRSHERHTGERLLGQRKGMEAWGGIMSEYHMSTASLPHSLPI